MNSLDEHTAKSEVLRLEEFVDEPILLIGGLAVQQYRRGRTSKDLDLVCSIEQLKKFDKNAYPSETYESDSNQTDLRPDIIYKNMETGVTIHLGPKILERPMYEFIHYDHYYDDAIPFRYDDHECEKIKIPAAHHLAFSKLISFIARRDGEKGHQDLVDFCDLTNHYSFSLSHFLAYVKRTSAEEHIQKFFDQTNFSPNEKKCLNTSCVLRVQRLLPNLKVSMEPAVAIVAKHGFFAPQFLNSVISNTSKNLDIVVGRARLFNYDTYTEIRELCAKGVVVRCFSLSEHASLKTLQDAVQTVAPNAPEDGKAYRTELKILNQSFRKDIQQWEPSERHNIGHFTYQDIPRVTFVRSDDLILLGFLTLFNETHNNVKQRPYLEVPVASEIGRILTAHIDALLGKETTSLLAGDLDIK